VRTYNVPHVGGADEEDADVVAPLQVVDCCAVLANGGTSTVVDVVLVVDQAYPLTPVPCILCPQRVGCVTSVFGCQSMSA